MKEQKHFLPDRLAVYGGLGLLLVLGLCALLYLLMKLLTVGTVKLCRWLWVSVKSLFVGKKGK